MRFAFLKRKTQMRFLTETQSFCVRYGVLCISRLFLNIKIDSSSESDLSSSDNEINEEESTMEYIKDLIVRVRKLSKCLRKSTKIRSFVAKLAKKISKISLLLL
jgi:hypothetical protein